MKTYIVPIDFSKASIHTAEYVASLSYYTTVEHIILLNAYYVSIYETTLPNADMVQLTQEQVDQNTADRWKNLETLKEKLIEKVKPGVKITTHVNLSHLVQAVVENSVDKNADLVILGSRGNTSDEDTQIGSHVIKIAKASPVPVVVVPPAYKFEEIKRVVVAIDFNKVEETVPLEALKRLLNKKNVDLLVVNIDTKGKHSHKDPQQMAEETVLHGMLKSYEPQYFYLNEPDIINGILKFAADKDAQLVISLPHKYSFFQSLLHDSVSHRLAESSAVPVLLLK